MIDFDKITFSNNYMFNTVMRRKELCRKCLERILGKNITDISFPDSERWIEPELEAKSIRLDIYCEDEIQCIISSFRTEPALIFHVEAATVALKVQTGGSKVAGIFKNITSS